MKLTDLIKTLIELNEHDPSVALSIQYDDGYEEDGLAHKGAKITNVTLADGKVTIYGEEE